MTHRSDQAVASQDRVAPQPDQPPVARSLLVGWATASAALVLSSALIAFGVWLARMPIAAFFIASALADRGVDADFQVVELDLSRAVIRGLRLGPEAAPDAAIASAEIGWSWQGPFSPRLRSVELTEPHLRLRLDPTGRVSAGALDRLRGRPSGRRPSIPAIELVVVGGEALIDAPFGTLEASFQSTGALGRNFSAFAQLAETSRPGRDYALGRAAGELTLASNGEAITFRLAASASSLTWAGARADDGALLVLGRAPLDLSRFDLEATWRAAALVRDQLRISNASGAFGGEALARESTLELAAWQSQARAAATEVRFGDARFQAVQLDARADGAGQRGRVRWALGAARLQGFAMVAERAATSGELTFDDGEAAGESVLILPHAALSATAQNQLRAAFPGLSGAPVAPTFASARQALSAASRSFEARIPFLIQGDDSGLRLRIAAPAEIRAASGARLRLAPLREDAPALVLQWPGASLHGAVAIELSGGGTPDATLLLDSLDWAREHPLEADGTLTLANWRSGGARIAADELGLALSFGPRSGRVELRGPVQISGPLGEGEVRDLAPDLNISLVWDQGWRIIPNQGCLPVRLGAIAVAGLSFTDGAFALCPHEGALFAADARGALAGGFSIQRLALSGRMAGPSAQPAQLRAASVTGRFSGRQGDVTLALRAEAPSLRVDLGEARALAVNLRRLSVDAHLAATWRVDGGFEHGALTDPNLPGAVSAIAGNWSAAPEAGAPVIRISAGEALLTANRPANDAQRALFNPLRLTGVSASFQNGRVDAEGQIVLADAARHELARFTAFHQIAAGAGGAEIVAPRLRFDESLQPYDITEQARGMVENVRGEAAVTADIAWTHERIAGAGRVRLDGLSLATSTIPIVEDVRGEVIFDDIFALTTPPGQSVTTGLVNPGVAVRNGRVRFQLLPERRVAIEQAEFDFAAGALAMSPTVITLGAEATRFELTLHDVDAADLVAQLNLPDLTATGRVEGAFPLLLTRRSAYIDNGVLRAQPGGGTIAYVGDAGASATGAAGLAFDALKSFHYDALELTLNGDLSGEVVSTITFSGENTGEPVDLGPIAPIPGVGRVTVRGVPFDFNVTVTAPFRRLAQTVVSVTDPGAILNQAEPHQQPVDQPASSPR